jgi:hypothetical protein
MTDNNAIQTEHKTDFKEWCILELMEHRKVGGLVSEQTIAGSAFLRIDIYSTEKVFATQLYSPAAVYCITPCSEFIARSYGDRYNPEPVTQWELPALKINVAGTPDDVRMEVDDYLSNDDQENY